MKISKESIQQMIMEELGHLDEKFTLDQWDALFGRDKPIGTVDSDKLTKFNDTNMSPKAVWDKLHSAGQDSNHLDIADIEYYIKNPDKIDPQIQSRLIAVSRAGGGGNEDKYNNILSQVKAAGEKLAKEKGKRQIKFPEPREQSDGKKISFGRGPAGSQYDTYREKYVALSNNTTRKQLLAMAAAAEKALAGLDLGIAKAAGEEKTLSYPEIRTQAGTTGSFPKGQLAVVNRLFSKFDTIEGRLKEITRISTKYYNASNSAASLDESESTDAIAELKQEFSLEPSKILNEIMILDIFNTLVKDTDSGSGAYTFEYFLALVTGGTVAGKMKTAGGKMGAADFIMGSELGSAKFFKDDTGHNIKQAISGFTDLYDGTNPVKIRYSIGLKKQGMTQIGKRRLGSADPNKIIAVEVYAPVVSYHGQDGFKINGESTKVKDGSVLIPTEGLESAGVMYICRTRTETFRQMLDDVMVNISDQATVLLDAFKLYFDSLRSANQNAKTYIANGDVEDGNKVHDSLTTAEEQFSKVKLALKDEDRFKQKRQSYYQRQMASGADFVEENKKNEINSLKALDKLIEQVILYKNTEEK